MLSGLYFISLASLHVLPFLLAFSSILQRTVSHTVLATAAIAPNQRVTNTVGSPDLSYVLHNAKVTACVAFLLCCGSARSRRSKVYIFALHVRTFKHTLLLSFSMLFSEK